MSSSIMKFCPECNNLLYPKEDRGERILHNACRRCDYQEVADNNCVYKNEIHHPVWGNTQILHDVSADPTLPRANVRCSNCNHGKAVFLLKFGEEGMSKIYVCCNSNCGHSWTD